MRLIFEPRADRQHFCVALASMVSKYLRELLMLEFNRFWQQQVSHKRRTSNNDLWEKVRARPNFSRNTQISACG